MSEYNGGRRIGGDRSIKNAVQKRGSSAAPRQREERKGELTEEEYQAYLKRKRQKKKKMERLRRRRRLLLLKMAGVLFIFIAFLLLVRRIFFYNPVEKKVTVEAGVKALDAKDFIKEKKRDKVEAEFVTDMSEIPLDHVGEYKIVIKAKGKERKSTLIIQDTVAPTAKDRGATVSTKVKPEAKDLVKSIKDATDVTCSFKKEPDTSQKGEVTITVVLTDEGGNTTEIDTKVKVVVDKEAPEIDGVGPLTAFIGDPISYKGEITVTDNCIGEVKLDVDNSEVDTETPGTYDITYVATDLSGNEAKKSTTITMKEKPDNYVDPETVYEEADKVLAEIVTDDMTLKEKAKAIYTWTRTNIGYVNTSDKESWTNGAYQGFTDKSGDCFVYFATAKALLTRVDIPNIDVVKSDTSHSSHYWSLVDVGDGWYHFDATPRQGGGDFFLLTDDEILEYSKAHNNSHIFDQSLYPATPTEDSTVD